MNEIVPLPAPESVVNLLTQAIDLRERETALRSTRIDCHAVLHGASTTNRRH